MNLNEIYTNWRKCILNVDYTGNGERIRGKLALSGAFISCYWSEDEEWLLFYSQDAGMPLSVMRCDASGNCYAKTPGGLWIKIGTIAQIGK